MFIKPLVPCLVAAYQQNRCPVRVKGKESSQRSPPALSAQLLHSSVYSTLQVMCCIIYPKGYIIKRASPFRQGLHQKDAQRSKRTARQEFSISIAGILVLTLIPGMSTRNEKHCRIDSSSSPIFDDGSLLFRLALQDLFFLLISYCF